MANPSPLSSPSPPQPAPAPAESPFISNLKGLGYCLFALVGGLVLLGWQWMSRSEATGTLQWPTVQGQVTSSEVQQKEVIRGKRIRTVFDPQIQYSYQVDGKDYTGSRIDYFGGHDSENEQTAATVLSKYPVGGNVKVSYNPKDPASSLLEPGMGSNSTFSWIMIGLGGFLTLIGLFGSVGSGYSLMAPKAADA